MLLAPIGVMDVDVLGDGTSSDHSNSQPQNIQHQSDGELQDELGDSEMDIDGNCMGRGQGRRGRGEGRRGRGEGLRGIGEDKEGEEEGGEEEGEKGGEEAGEQGEQGAGKHTTFYTGNSAFSHNFNRPP